jgi:hypothetical protein
MNCVQRVQELEDRLDDLAQRLLPPFRTTGSYTPRQLDHTRGYRLLAHAEIEACLEDLARGVVLDTHSAWDNDGLPRKSIISLVAYNERSLGAPPRTLPLAGPSDVGQRVLKAKNVFSKHVSDNNGVRETNVLKLLLPVGVTEYNIDQTWLATIDSFGQWRGDTAHKAAKQAKFLPDPATEVNTVSVILDGLKKLAVELDQLQV